MGFIISSHPFETWFYWFVWMEFQYFTVVIPCYGLTPLSLPQLTLSFAAQALPSICCGSCGRKWNALVTASGHNENAKKKQNNNNLPHSRALSHSVNVSLQSHQITYFIWASIMFMQDYVFSPEWLGNEGISLWYGRCSLIFPQCSRLKLWNAKW